MYCMLLLYLFIWAECPMFVVDDNPSNQQRKAAYTFLGTIKGEVDKVSEGGRKIEVKYKELVATTRSVGSSLPRTSSAKLRPPTPKELVLKEKNQELELRVLNETIIRLVDAAAQEESKSPPRKSSSSKASKKEMDKDDDSRQDQKQDDPPAKKNSSKTPRKPAEQQLPGKPGDVTSLAKGQIVIVSVSREDLPGYSRLVASTIYILGEK